MESIPQYNATGCKIPLWIVANSGNFPGTGGANPTIQLSRELSPEWVNATGTIIDALNGCYWYTPSAQDSALVGKVVGRVIGPIADILPPIEFVVTAPSVWQQLLSAPQNLASLAANFRLFLKNSIPPNQQGLIQ